MIVPFFNANTLAKSFSALLLMVLLTGCYSRGGYRYGGEFQNVQLPATGKKIGILDPRGPFGDEAATTLVQKTVAKAFKKCPTTQLLTESELYLTYKIPALTGNGLSEADLDWFTKNTPLDYLILTDVGPGQLEGTPTNLRGFTADREASVLLTVYDLADGGALKTITVTGTLMLKEDPRWYELEYKEEQIGRRALKKSVKRLARFSDCG